MFAVIGIGGGELVLLMVVLPMFAFWVWMLVSAIQNKGLTNGEKIGWVLAIALLHFIGAIVYFFVGHPKRKLPPVV